MTSIVLPREPRTGDFFTGQVTRRCRDHRYLLVWAEIPLHLPLSLLGDQVVDPDSLVGQWVECEVVEVVREKQVVVVRPLVWPKTDEEIRASQQKNYDYWWCHNSKRDQNLAEQADEPTPSQPPRVP
jgi:hypothetical protein